MHLNELDIYCLKNKFLLRGDVEVHRGSLTSPLIAIYMRNQSGHVHMCKWYRARQINCLID